MLKQKTIGRTERWTFGANTTESDATNSIKKHLAETSNVANYEIGKFIRNDNFLEVEVHVVINLA